MGLYAALYVALMVTLGLLYWKAPSWRGPVGILLVIMSGGILGALVMHEITAAPTDNNHDQEEEGGGEGLQEDTDPRTPPGYPAELPTPPVDYTRERDEAIPDDALDPDDRARAERRAGTANDAWDEFFKSLDGEE